MTETIKLSYTNFWNGFHPNELFYITNLYQRYNIQWVSPEDNPDLIIKSVFRNNHFKCDIPTLLFSGENVYRWSYSVDNYDWVFATNSTNCFNKSNVYHLPQALYNTDPKQLQLEFNQKSSDDWLKIIKNKSKFCCFISSNFEQSEGCNIRNTLFNRLSTIDHVDSAGKVYNNMPNGQTLPYGKPMMDFISDHKFMICAENSSGDGYFTEKIINPYLASTVPIYWSHPSVFNYIKSESMIFNHEMEKTVETVKQINLDVQKYFDILTCQPLIEDLNNLNSVMNRERINNVMISIIEQLKH